MTPLGPPKPSGPSVRALLLRRALLSRHVQRLRAQGVETGRREARRSVKNRLGL